MQRSEADGGGGNVVPFLKKYPPKAIGRLLGPGSFKADPFRGSKGGEADVGQVFSDQERTDGLFKPRDLSWIKEFDEELARINAQQEQSPRRQKRVLKRVRARRLRREQEKEEAMPDDREYLDAKMEAQEYRLKSDIDRVENKLSNEVSAVRSEMTNQFAAVHAELKVITNKLQDAPTRWTVWGTAGTVFATTAALLFTVLALMGDRFDAGVGMGAVVQQVQENKAENDDQGRKLDAILEILRDNKK